VAAAVRDLYGRIDPASVQAMPQLGGGMPMQMSPEELQERARKAVEEATKKAGGAPGGTP
jgi:hypothetical protein